MSLLVLNPQTLPTAPAATRSLHSLKLSYLPTSLLDWYQPQTRWQLNYIGGTSLAKKSMKKKAALRRRLGLNVTEELKKSPLYLKLTFLVLSHFLLNNDKISINDHSWKTWWREATSYCQLHNLVHNCAVFILPWSESVMFSAVKNEGRWESQSLLTF